MTGQSESREAHSVSGGIIPGMTGHPAFTEISRHPSPIPVLIAVPHAGRVYPPALVERLRHPAEAVLKLEDRYIDLVAAEVARQTGAGLLVAHAPRAMIDLNRSVEDMDWDMLVKGAAPGRPGRGIGRRARSGLGLVPRRVPGLGELWKRRIEPTDLDERITGVHDPYHHALGEGLGRLRARWGAALLIDMHSMPPLPLRSPDESPPHFVLGDRFGASCDGALCAAAFDELARHRRLAAHNRPYAGGYVLDRHAAPAKGIHALQLEICRSTYLDERMAEPAERMARLVEVMVALVRRLAGEVAALDRPVPLPHAAE